MHEYAYTKRVYSILEPVWFWDGYSFYIVIIFENYAHTYDPFLIKKISTYLFNYNILLSDRPLNLLKFQEYRERIYLIRMEHAENSSYHDRLTNSTSWFTAKIFIFSTRTNFITT